MSQNKPDKRYCCYPHLTKRRKTNEIINMTNLCGRYRNKPQSFQFSDRTLTSGHKFPTFSHFYVFLFKIPPPKEQIIQSGTEIIPLVLRSFYNKEMRKSKNDLIFIAITVITPCQITCTP